MRTAGSRDNIACSFNLATVVEAHMADLGSKDVAITPTIMQK